MKIYSYAALLFLFLLLSSCAAPAEPPQNTLPPAATATKILPTATSGPTATSAPLAFSQPGKYPAGIRRMITYVDESRGGRKVTLTIWYPAIVPSGTPQTETYNDAEMDLNAAPYPLIMTTTKNGFIFGPHLATHGFVVAGINGLDTYLLWNAAMVQQPLDYLFALDNLANNPPEFLAGHFDVNRTGVMGYSFDGLNALWLSGARVYPQFLFDFCSNGKKATPQPPEWYSEYICNLEKEWAEFEAAAGEKYTSTTDGMWEPVSDPRIIASMPMAPDGARLFGDRGLAAANRPVLMIANSEDEMIPRAYETDYIFYNLGSAEKDLIVFMGLGHMMVDDQIPRSWIRHFATAFFGYHLQSNSDYAQYYSSEYLSKYPQFMLNP